MCGRRAKRSGPSPIRDIDRVVAPPNAPRKRRRRYGGALLGGSVLLLLLGGLGIGGWRHYAGQRRSRGHRRAAAATFVPTVRVAAVRASDSNDHRHACRRPRLAFDSGEYLCARQRLHREAQRRYRRSRSRPEQLLAQITAPELDHQIAQAEATLAQNQATLQQTQANRELAQVT